MSTTTAPVCASCGVQDGAIGNWSEGGIWMPLPELLSGFVSGWLPVPVREARVTDRTGRDLCQHCANDTRTEWMGVIE